MGETFAVFVLNHESFAARVNNNLHFMIYMQKLVCTNMSLFQEVSSTPVVLPDGNGPLCKDVPSSFLLGENLEVSRILKTVA